jgi:hypothetical protein
MKRTIEAQKPCFRSLFKVKADDGKLLLEGSGIVCWARLKGNDRFPPGCGIEFTFLSEAYRKKILETLRVVKPRAFIPNR